VAKDNATIPSLQVLHERLRSIAEIDEFKGRGEALQTLSPERCAPCATIENIGSSTRIEGGKLTDQRIETLLSTLQRRLIARPQLRDKKMLDVGFQCRAIQRSPLPYEPISAQILAAM
jgi:hypothetical protein